MAFQGSSRRYPCWDCQREFTWFAMIDSNVIRSELDAKAVAASSSWEMVEAGRGAGQCHQGAASKGTEIPMNSQPAQPDQEDHGDYRVV